MLFTSHIHPPLPKLLQVVLRLPGWGGHFFEQLVVPGSLLLASSASWAALAVPAATSAGTPSTYTATPGAILDRAPRPFPLS